MMKKFCTVSLMLFLLFHSVGCKNNQKKEVGQANNTTEYQTPEWATKLIEAYKAFNEERNLQSATLVFNASEEMPVKNWENYLVCAMVFAENEKPEKAFMAINRAIEFGLKDVDLLTGIPAFNPLKDSSGWDSLISRASQKREEYLSSIQNPVLLKELEYLWSKDQQALSEYEQNIALLDSSATIDEYNKLFEPVKERWQVNKRKLDSIVQRYGWPDNDLVGEEGTKIAWSIAQHHPDVFFKKKCLGLIKEKMVEGKVNPNHYAELKDRIARDTWQKQTYGASMGKEAPHPIKNVSEVNKRRLELGLPEPIEVYALYHGISYEIPSEKEVRERYGKAQSEYKNFENKIASKEIDSSMVYLRKAIKAHGDVSDEQLFEAAKKLAETGNQRAQNLGMDILKVLIWREWKQRFDILEEPHFNSLKNSKQWGEIRQLLDKSQKM